MDDINNIETSAKKDFVYAAKTQTNITLEQSSAVNPYVAKVNFLHGYNVIDLMEKKSFVEVLLLLFVGELPEPTKVQLFERLMIVLMNLGPRHPAVKAAMVAGVSKANAEHLLPIGLSVLGGKSNGAKEVERAVTFLQCNIAKPAAEVANKLIIAMKDNKLMGEFHLCPGFGNHYGGIDEYTSDVAKQITTDIQSEFSFINWASDFSECIAPYHMGWLKTGLAAAVFCELGIGAREAIGLFQLICAPGIFAHGIEQTHKPITAIPMLSDEEHVYQLGVDLLS
ncbi:MAG: citrate synthase [Gammaproteobacteria bacterium]|nr:MAG: citrate synthase [Gammaproteobacteria bacterium]